MSNTSFIFPGEGCGHAGMGKTLYERFDSCKDIYSRASEIWGFDAAELSFKGKTADINSPEVSFLLVFAHSLSVLAAARELGIAPEIFAGYSAGELTAITASGVYTLEDGCRAAKMYIDMRRAAMGAGKLECFRLTNVRDDFVSLVTNRVMDGFVQMVAVEAPEQTVIVGDRDGIEKTLSELQKHSVVSEKLKNASPIHSLMVFPYTVDLKAAMKELPHQDVETSMYSNLYGGKIEKFTSPADYFPHQQMSAVQFSKEISAMQNDGINRFVIAGPDKALASAIKKVAKDSEILVVEDIKGLEKLQ